MADYPKFLLFDGRAKAGLLDRAMVLDTAATAEEARRELASGGTWEGHDVIWGEVPPGNASLEEKHLRWDLLPKEPDGHGTGNCR